MSDLAGDLVGVARDGGATGHGDDRGSGPGGAASEAVAVPADAEAQHSYFFGFHDLTPWEPSGERLVCLRARLEERRLPEAQDLAEVCVVAAGEPAVAVGETRAWNWQQAARQQWVPGGASRIVYNVATDGGFAARLVDLASGAGRTLDGPVYQVARDGRFALGLDYLRLSRLYRSYGYAHRALPAAPPADRAGVTRIDLQTGAATVVVSLAEVAELARIDAQREQFLTHVSIAPDDKALCFLHRALTASGGVETRLLWARIDGTGLRVLADDRVSHFGWWDAGRIVAWTRENRAIRRVKTGALARFARPLFRLSRRLRGAWVRQHVYGEEFRAYDPQSGRSRPFARGVIDCDGHPQVNPTHRDVWVNDTYPDADGEQTLMLYHAVTAERCDVARLATPAEIRETGWRCDLHPRWDPAGRRICVDSAHRGRRRLYVLDVSSTLEGLLRRARTGGA